MSITQPQVQAAALFVLAFLITVTIAVLGVREDPPDVAVNVLLVVLAGVFQVSGVSRLHSTGKAHPTLVRAAVSRLTAMLARTNGARAESEAAFETGEAGDLYRSMGRVSVELSFLEEGLIESIRLWKEVHPEALRSLEGGDSDAKTEN